MTIAPVDLLIFFPIFGGFFKFKCMFSSVFATLSIHICEFVLFSYLGETCTVFYYTVNLA